jgi:hypothetical protein
VRSHSLIFFIFQVLKALSNRVTNAQRLTYCVYNGPRPKLSVGPVTGFPGRRQAYHYAQSIKKFGYLLEDNLLDKAYNRAQMFFSGIFVTLLHHCFLNFQSALLPLGELERTFLVLREVIAIRRLNERTGQPGGAAGNEVTDQPGNVNEIELPPRGTKRKENEASTPSATTSKRPNVHD